MTRALPPPDVLDLKHLERQTFGDRALERELLILFQQQCVRLFPIIAGGGPAIERADAAHTLKGSAGGVGAWQVAAVAGSLESALDDAEPARTIERLLVKLERAIEATRAAVAERDQPAAA